jgi:hypothetical protein
MFYAGGSFHYPFLNDHVEGEFMLLLSIMVFLPQVLGQLDLQGLPGLQVLLLGLPPVLPQEPALQSPDLLADLPELPRLRLHYKLLK